MGQFLPHPSSYSRFLSSACDSSIICSTIDMSHDINKIMILNIWTKSRGYIDLQY